jgi:hypothetical protein
MKSIPIVLLVLFLFYVPDVLAQVNRYGLAINEIMADPSPIVGLPNAEFIELRNNSTSTINLNRWSIKRGNSRASIQVNYLLKPDSLVVICSRTQAVFFNALGNTIGISSFPSLGNEGDLILLLSPEGKTMDAVEYDSSFYGNTLKAQGGWTMELVNPRLPCERKNWKASINNKGGTPGKENSVFDTLFAAVPLQALQCIAISNRELLLVLNRGADSTSLAQRNNYELLPQIGQPIHTRPLGPLFNRVQLQLPEALKEKQVYVLKAKNLLHCNGKDSDTISIKTGLTVEAKADNIVINEIMFNPPPGGHDFVEIFNKGQEIINLRNIYLSNENAAGIPGIPIQVSTTDHNFFPGEYRVLTEKSEFLKRRWDCDEASIIQPKTLPSLPDSKGNILLMNKQGVVVDAFYYTADMHFPLIHDKSGVSLERIDPSGNTNDKQNWHSASASVRYASPTKTNSQYVSPQQSVDNSSKSSICIEPDLISPNNDGVHDRLLIHYDFDEPGTLLSAHLFNAAGRYISTIVNNRLCGKTGVFVWNGLDNKHMKASSGLYIVLVETFHLNGKSKTAKKAVIVK